LIIVGINAYHGDSSACLIKDGVLIAAAEEERFRRLKHWAGFPSQAIDYCLREAGISLSDVAHVAVNSDPRAHFWRKIWFVLSTRPKARLITDRLRNRRRRLSINAELATAFPGSQFTGKVHRVEHHLAHLASAYLVSPFDNAVAVSVDGFGDFSSAAWGMGTGASISVDGNVHFPHSLGIFYQAMTQYLGFPHYGDEYKVMGLAPYGIPRYLDLMRQIVLLSDDGSFRLNLDFFNHHKTGVEYRWDRGEPFVGRLYTAKIESLLGPSRKSNDEVDQRHKDIARSVQVMYEEAFFNLLNALHNKYENSSVALAGGCAMNSVANGKIHLRTPFRKVYVQSAAGDAGGAIGAAMAVWHRLHTAARRDRMMHAYWGPEFSDAYIKNLLNVHSNKIHAEGCKIVRVDSENDLCRLTAASIDQGMVVGWFQGRMEWGPRALGNRSILGDPRRADMKDILNLKIKRRESFRPFAPSILREAVPQWFEADADVPFMMEVFQIRENMRSLIPAVTHVDGSGRLQTVHCDTNPRYYRLIECFDDITGVPMLLNTSFNENEPVVCQPEEALDCFLRTKMDLLVMGNWMVSRGSNER